jgi:hypothetical protein
MRGLNVVRKLLTTRLRRANERRLRPVAIRSTPFSPYLAPTGLALLAGSTLGPQHNDGYAPLAGVGDDIGSSADATGGLAVPYRHQALAMIDHRLPCGQVRLLGRFDERQPLDMLRLGEQFVVAVPLIWVESIPILLGGHHDLKRSAKVQHRAREQLVRSAGQAAHPNQLGAGVRLQLLAQGGGDQLFRARR